MNNLFRGTLSAVLQGIGWSVAGHRMDDRYGHLRVCLCCIPRAYLAGSDTYSPRHNFPTLAESTLRQSAMGADPKTDMGSGTEEVWIHAREHDRHRGTRSQTDQCRGFRA